jgi:hypothetical protein
MSNSFFVKIYKDGTKKPLFQEPVSGLQESLSHARTTCKRGERWAVVNSKGIVMYHGRK